MEGEKKGRGGEGGSGKGKGKEEVGGGWEGRLRVF